MSADLWVVTSYFNPCGYRERPLTTSENGLLDWSAEAPAELRACVEENFERREEDGDAGVTEG